MQYCIIMGLPWTVLIGLISIKISKLTSQPFSLCCMHRLELLAGQCLAVVIAVCHLSTM